MPEYEGRLYALFCGKCKHPIRIAGVASMPDITHAKTELPGIICSNCSTPVPPDYDFCAECGKAVNGSPFVPPPPPPPPPPSSKSGNSANSFTASMDAGKETYAAKNIRSDVGSLGSPEAITSILKDPTFKIIAFAVGGIVLFGILVAAISSGTKSTVLSSNPANTTKPTPVIAGTPNSSNSDYRIRKNGTLTRDVNLRQYAGKDYRSDGIQYRGARVTILDVTSVLDVNGESFEWFKVQITSYGRSMDANNGDRSKDPGSLDVGWIHSYPNISQTKSVNRVVTVNIDN